MMYEPDPRRANSDQRAPGLEATAGKYSSANFYEKAIAQPRHMQDRTRRSHEELRAEEGLAAAAAPPFYQSVHDADRTVANEYQYIEAGQANGRVEPGRSNPRPTWQHIPGQVTASFADASNGDQGPPVRRPVISRDHGSDNPSPRAPVEMPLAAGERPRQIIPVAQADPSAPWRYSRPNQAEVEGRP